MALVFSPSTKKKKQSALLSPLIFCAAQPFKSCLQHQIKIKFGICFSNKHLRFHSLTKKESAPLSSLVFCITQHFRKLFIAPDTNQIWHLLFHQTLYLQLVPFFQLLSLFSFSFFKSLNGSNHAERPLPSFFIFVLSKYTSVYAFML